MHANVTAAIKDDARAHRHGWKMAAHGGVTAHASVRQFETKEDLLKFIYGQTRFTHPVQSVIGLYPMAATHVCALEAAGQISFVQNNSLIFALALPPYSASAAAYWTEHVCGSFPNSSQNPGHGAE
jgi:hypothetical protein